MPGPSGSNRNVDYIPTYTALRNLVSSIKNSANNGQLTENQNTIKIPCPEIEIVAVTSFIQHICPSAQISQNTTDDSRASQPAIKIANLSLIDISKLYQESSKQLTFFEGGVAQNFREGIQAVRNEIIADDKAKEITNTPSQSIQQQTQAQQEKPSTPSIAPEKPFNTNMKETYSETQQSLLDRLLASLCKKPEVKNFAEAEETKKTQSELATTLRTK